MKWNQWVIFMITGMLLAGCQPSRYLSQGEVRELDNAFRSEDMNHHIGFVVQDLRSGVIVHSINADKYFTPASNTKTLSLATGLAILGDSIPFLHYYTRGDTLYIRGLGDPTFLHEDFDSDRVISFLKSHAAIVMDQSNFKSKRYGSGWSWDDFNGAYQVERSAFPIYGNTLVFKDEVPTVSYFEKDVNYQKSNNPIRIYRERRQNKFNIYGSSGQEVRKKIPLVMTRNLTTALLEDTLTIPVLSGQFDPTQDYRTLYSYPVDSLYKPMMVRSDNFFADQILMMAAQQELGEMNESKIISWVKKNALKSPDEFLWYDGSGLSRYNQFTPRSMVYLYDMLEKKYGLERLQNILSQGGVSGTVKHWYGNTSGAPYIFAKTGSLRNVYCLSGYLKADSGRWYVFSFMNNNFPGSSSTVKGPMEKILMQLKTSL